jgi:hypothetical protein
MPISRRDSIDVNNFGRTVSEKQAFAREPAGFFEFRALRRHFPLMMSPFSSGIGLSDV